MSLVNSSATVQGSINWKQTKTVTGFNSSEQAGNISFPAVAITADYPYFTTFTLAAAASQTLDLRAITTALGDSVTASGFWSFIFTATATVTGGILKIKPGASNGLVVPFGDATDFLSLPVGTTLGARLILSTGTINTIDATHKTYDISNPGTQTITVKFGVLVDD